VTVDRLVHCIRYLPWMSAAQLADVCRVPSSQYKAFCALLIEAVEAGRVEHRNHEAGGFVIPQFQVTENPVTQEKRP
jgi:hypothetical protein